ncbi:MAG: HigA family addiction module antidote protein [Sandaracinaceae bacterium]|nr:HigA family addiction module antidote protein [Sandaracinaceae bacterium]
MTKSKRLRNIHPGEVLLEEFLEPMGVSQYALAKAIHVPLTRIVEICARRRIVTADTALRLAKFFGTTPKFWLGLQEDFDLEELQREKGNTFGAIQPLARTA